MTDPPLRDHPSDDDRPTRLSSLERRLRREKAALERLNPLAEPERYAEDFARVIELEASRRDLRTSLGADDDVDDGGRG